MNQNLIKEGKFSYIEAGEGQPIIVLHGLMGTLSNFGGVFDYFSTNLLLRGIIDDCYC